MLSLLYKGVVVVHDVYDNGAAAKDARLLPGDLILEVIISSVFSEQNISAH